MSKIEGEVGGCIQMAMGADSMAVSGNHWLEPVGPFLSSFARAENTVLLPCMASISGSEAFFPV